MIEIKQVKRFGVINGDLSLKVFTEIWKACSYKRKGSQYMANPEWAWKRLFNRKKKCFPIGLWDRVKKILDDNDVRYNACFDFMKGIRTNNDYNVSTMGLRYYQIEALRMFMIHRGGIFKMATGTGKTRTSVEALKIFEPNPTLVLVPTIDLVSQWKSYDLPSNVHVMTYASIKKPSYIQQFNLIIFDECHHVAAKTLYKIAMSAKLEANIYGLSATPFDRDDDNMLIEAALGNIIFEYGLRDAINDGFLCDAKIFYHEVPEKFYFDSDYQEVYKDYIVENDERNKLILTTALTAIKPCLILVNHIDHGEKLYNMLDHYGFDSVNFIHGQMEWNFDDELLYDTLKDLKLPISGFKTFWSGCKRRDNDHDIIIASNVYDEGVDIPRLRELIIASGGKSAIKVFQRVGRLLRPFSGKDYAIIHDFFDNDGNWLFRQSKERYRIISNEFEVKVVC